MSSSTQPGYKNAIFPSLCPHSTSPFDTWHRTPRASEHSSTTIMALDTVDGESLLLSSRRSTGDLFRGQHDFPFSNSPAQARPSMRSHHEATPGKDTVHHSLQRRDTSSTCGGDEGYVSDRSTARSEHSVPRCFGIMHCGFRPQSPADGDIGRMKRKLDTAHCSDKRTLKPSEASRSISTNPWIDGKSHPHTRPSLVLHAILASKGHRVMTPMPAPPEYAQGIAKELMQTSNQGSEMDIYGKFCLKGLKLDDGGCAAPIQRRRALSSHRCDTIQGASAPSASPGASSVSASGHLWPVVQSPSATPPSSTQSPCTPTIPAGSELQGLYKGDCRREPKTFESTEEPQAHKAEKKYKCEHCPMLFKNKNEATRHVSSKHLRKLSWSCAALPDYNHAFHESSSQPGEADTCGYCGRDFPRSGVGPGKGDLHGGAIPRHATEKDNHEREQHVRTVHKFLDCSLKKFYRADNFRQHLKHSHSSSSGMWTRVLEKSCKVKEGPPGP